MPLQLRNGVIKNQINECDAFVNEMLEPGWCDFGYAPWNERLDKEMAGGSEEGESDVTAPLAKTSAPVITAGPRTRGKGKAKQDVSLPSGVQDAGKGQIKPKVCGIEFIGCLTDQIRSCAPCLALDASRPVKNAFFTP